MLWIDQSQLETDFYLTNEKFKLLKTHTQWKILNDCPLTYYNLDQAYLFIDHALVISYARNKMH